MDTVAPRRGPDFATGLRAAIRRSGLGLDTVQRRLAARGVPVSVATLSYWQNGQRSPGRRRSEEVVAHLEAVLDLPPRELRSLIPPPRRRTPRAQAPGPLPRGFTEQAAVRRIAQSVAHCRGSLLTRISQHDVVWVGPDRRVSAMRSRMVMRADTQGIESIGLTQFFEDPGAGTPHVQVLSGGTVVARRADPRHRVAATEVWFGRELRYGETILLEFEVTSDGPGPADRAYDTSCGVRIRELAVQARFCREDPPTRCESYRRTAGEEEAELRRRLEVGALGHVHTVALGLPSGTVGLAWDWADDGPAVKS